MTLPASVRVNAQFPFPATVQGVGPIVISKAGGIWNVNIGIAQLGSLQGGFNPATNILLVYDLVAQTFVQATVSQIAGTAAIVGAPQRLITASGSVTVLVGDSIILLNKTVGAATDVILPTAISRNGAPLTVKDLKGDSQTNNIRLVVNGVETIDGFSQANADSNGTSKIAINFGKKIITPITAGGGWFIL